MRKRQSKLPKLKATTLQKHFKNEIAKDNMRFSVSNELVEDAVYNKPQASRKKTHDAVSRETTQRAWEALCRARDEWTEAVKRLNDTHPVSPDFMDTAGIAHATKQQYLAAVEHFRDAVGIN